MKKGLGYYSIVIGSLAVAVPVVLGGLILIYEGLIGVRYSQVSFVPFIPFLIGGLILLGFGSKLFIAEKRM